MHAYFLVLVLMKAKTVIYQKQVCQNHENVNTVNHCICILFVILRVETKDLPTIVQVDIGLLSSLQLSDHFFALSAGLSLL
jgi:uncharacterized membrane protein YiaA